MKKVEGDLLGLKTSEKRGLERLYRRKIKPEEAINPEVVTTLCALSFDIGRQVGLIIDRRGRIEHVIVGDKNEVVIPEFARGRTSAGRLSGLRLIHSHLRNEPLSRDDINDLVMLRLDLIMAVGVGPGGEPADCSLAYLNTDPGATTPWKEEETVRFSSLDFDFAALVAALDAEYAALDSRQVKSGDLGALLVHISPRSALEAQIAINELSELARTERINTLDNVVYRSEINPKSLVGEGRLKDLVVRAATLKADMLLFDQEMTAAQARFIASVTDMPILDRTQLIHRIFARRAHTADGKLRVELARLQYQLPRIGARDDALSRIRGGIGMRGPGETAMEVSRRRIQDRMRVIKDKLKWAEHGRVTRRSKRKRAEVAQVAIVGYTNAGKSTLLNALTKSQALTEDKLFATLDPMSRRVRFPKEREVVISDTVGFIRDLPAGLLDAFRSTLEELSDADILIHLVDVSAPDMESEMETVDTILKDLGLGTTPVVVALNKTDQADPERVANMSLRCHGLPISALTREGLDQLIDAIVARLGEKVGGEE